MMSRRTREASHGRSGVSPRGPYFAAAVQGGLVALAMLLGWAAGFGPFEHLHWDWRSAAWGVAGAVPLFAAFYVLDWLPIESMRRIHNFLVETIGPALAACRWYDLVLLALFVGFAEELLFRGVVQPWLEPMLGWLGAIVLSNAIFGVLHAATRTYAVLAALLGVYMGLLLDFGGTRNVLTPMLAHAVYDLCGFFVIAREYRRHAARAVVYTADPADDGPIDG